MFNIAVITSGHSRGSNLRAMAEYFLKHELPIRICFVIRTVETAPVAEVCDAYNLTCHQLSYKDKALFEEKVKYLADYHQVHLIALAGFLKCLSEDFIRDVGCPILNIHPALLPKYGGKGMYGMAVHRAVWENQDKFSGASIHIVNEHYDEGDVIAQKRVDISECHSPEDIALAVLKAEHSLYGKTIWEYLQKLYG